VDDGPRALNSPERQQPSANVGRSSLKTAGPARVSNKPGAVHIAPPQCAARVTIPLMAKTIFVGSSLGARAQARRVVDFLVQSGHTPVPWWTAFTPGNTLLQLLDVIAGRVDGALLLFSPENQAVVRGNAVYTPNLNVLFELGFFYGKLGARKVAMIPYGSFYLPSDLGGYIHVTGSKFFNSGQGVAVSKKTAAPLNAWLAQV
jgi:predicted nucleotide-binding protein